MSYNHASPITHSAQLRICIVTPDLLGPVRNGGIGTACTFLAEELAAAGHAVSILFSQIGTAARQSDPWVTSYRAKNIDVDIVEEWLKSHAITPLCPAYPPLAMAHYVDQWLAVREFDLVILMEWQGHGFYALNAKQAGLRFQNTVFLTQLHSPSLWHALNNADLPSEPIASLGYFMERKSVELADIVISPSAYMLDWVKRHGFRPPAHAYVLPNLIGATAPAGADERKHVEIRELVFFGRLEYRKGLAQFCDALDRLHALNINPTKVTFLGKFSRMGQEHSGLYISRRAKRWNFPVEIQARMGQSQALAYLSEPGRLAVMPSVADNSPYTVYECLVARIPFLARDVGGVAELIDPSHHGCLFDDNPGSLARLFASVLKAGCLVPQLAFKIEDNRHEWREKIPQLIRNIQLAGEDSGVQDVRNKMPRVSVCLTHYNRHTLLLQAVASLIAQDYPNFEVILVDDGSPGPDNSALLDMLERDFSKRGWKILRLENGYLGKARNTAVKHAEGEYLLFMDDDNVAFSDMISRFVGAATRSGADLVTAMFDVFGGDEAPKADTKVVERFLPLGGIVSFSLLTNVIGDANSLIKRSVFDRLGGFTQDYGLGHEDFELYLRAVLAGTHVCVVPEPLFWYRRNGHSMLSDTHAAANRMRSFRPFFDALPAPLAEMAVLAHGAVHHGHHVVDNTQLARADLSDADRSHLCAGDPDGPAAVTALAKYLILDGQDTMADGLLTQLEQSGTASDRTELAYIQLLQRFSAALGRGDLKSATSVAEEFTTAEVTQEAKASLYQALLSALAERTDARALIRICANRLVQCSGNDYVALLVAARHLIAVGQIAESVEALIQALVCADNEYLLKRPDVSGAVKRHAFASGLDHFMRHGKAEQVSWPQAHHFASVVHMLMTEIQNGTSLRLEPHAHELLILAVRTFGKDHPKLN